MFVETPWNHASLIQQILANLKPSERAGYSEIDLLITPRQELLFREQLNIFNALEGGETIRRPMLHEKGD